MPNNVFIGKSAGHFSTTNSQCIMIGKHAGQQYTGESAIIIGVEAADAASSSGNQQVIIGNFACGSGSLSGNANVVIGYSAGSELAAGADNTIVGPAAGDTLTTSGTNNIIIGHDADAASATTSNTVTLGNGSITALRCQVTSITALSDERDKTDIETLEAGLEFVEQLDPVSFTWNTRDGSKVGVEEIQGFIAQDLQQVQEDTGITIPNLVYDENPDKLEAVSLWYVSTFVLVKAIQELSAKVEDLEAQLNP